jgi:threonine synthase
MDIQVSSNFERFLFEASGRDAGFVRGKMQILQQNRSMELGEAMQPYRESFIAERVDQAAVGDCIRRVEAQSGYLLDPHSACAVVAAQRQAAAFSSSPAVARVALATAHPAKFPEALEAIVGKRPALPGRLDYLLSQPERVTTLPNDLGQVQRFVERCATTVWGPGA